MLDFKSAVSFKVFGGHAQWLSFQSKIDAYSFSNLPLCPTPDVTLPLMFPAFSQSETSCCSHSMHSGLYAAQAAKAGCIFTTFVDQLTIEKCPGPFPTFEMCN